MPAQNDTWWHLREGELLWHRGAGPLRDYFSHTVYGGNWENREWLSQVLFYGLYRTGGLPLLTGILACAVVAAWSFSWRLAPGRASWRAVLTAAAATAASPDWALRPQVLSFFFVGLTAFLITRRRLLWLPPVFLVWANLHGGVVLGWLLLGVAVMLTVVGGRRRDAVQVTATAVVSFLLTGLTPLGTTLWTGTLAAVQRMRAFDIAEFHSPRLTDVALLPFWIMTAALLVLIVAAKPWVPGSPARHFVVAGAAGLLPLALVSSRSISAMLLLAVPAVILLAESVVPAQAPTDRGERPTQNAIVLGLAVLSAAGVVMYGWAAPALRLHWHPLPEGAAAAIESCRPNLYNRFDEGGYIIWFAPAQRVFVDSRFDPYPADLLHEHVRVEASGDYTSLFQRFGIHCAFLPRESVLSQRLGGDGWKATYDRDGWVVLQKD